MVTYDLGEQEISQRQVERDRESRKKLTKTQMALLGLRLPFSHRSLFTCKGEIRCREAKDG